MTNICIISSWTENLNIVKICQQLSIDHTIVIDSLFWPYQDKENKFSQERVIKIMEYMSNNWATHFILSPDLELSLITHSKFSIIPLFKDYLTYCFNNSLVGKIGFIGWYSNIQEIEILFKVLSAEYKPTENQKKIKKFKLSKRVKDTTLWLYFTRLLSPRNMMINKILKTDLKYFKDANIDTLIPLNYSYFKYQKTITSFFNQKKCKFHNRDTIEQIFFNIFKKYNYWSLNSTNLTVYYTWSLHLISEEKKWERLLSQGKQKDIEYKQVII